MNRRQFLASAAGAALAAPFAFTPHALAAAPHSLRIVQRTIEVNKRAAKVFGLLQANGTHGLTLPAGSAFDVALRNDTAEPTIIHWHGLTPPFEQDGVPDAPQPLLAAQATRDYRFPVGAPGTHWMHAHTLQEQGLLAAPLIVTDPASAADEQDVVILLHDFSFAPPEELLAKLQGGGHGMSAMNPPMNGMNHNMGGMNHAMPSMSGMPMMAMDINDIDYDAYLANDRTLDDPEAVKVEDGGRVRLRIINGGTATAFTIDLGVLEGALIAVDGQDVTPVTGRRFPIAMGQRLDIRLTLPRGTAEAFPVLALREGERERTGIVLAPPNAAIRKPASSGSSKGPVVGLDLEQRLKAAKPLAPRAPDRRIDMMLTGGMQGYRWGLDTQPGLVVRAGQRVEVTMTNMSMMAHPMHLHGHHFQVVAIDGRRFDGALRDTVQIPPHRAVTVAFDAGNPGTWAFHCHHLYHMATGMMAMLDYNG